MKKKSLKEDFKALALRFWEFLPNFFIFFVIFFIWLGISGAIIFPIQFGFTYLGVPYIIIKTVCSIILSITPIFPIMYFWRGRNTPGEEDIEGAVMDCCFTAWIILLVIVWLNFYIYLKRS